MEWQNVEKGKTNKDTKKEGSKSKEVALPKAGKGPVNLESNSAFSVLDVSRRAQTLLQDWWAGQGEYGTI